MDTTTLAHEASPTIQSSTYGLYYEDQFLGTAFAVAPRIALSAGHHIKVTKDPIDFLSLRSLKTSTAKPAAKSTKAKQKSHGASGRFGVDYVTKGTKFDVLVLWVDNTFPTFTPLFSLLPPVGTTLLMTYVSLSAPHDSIVVSPGTVIANSPPHLCRLKGTISQPGTSGGPVLDAQGQRVVGMHVASFEDDTTKERSSEFVSGRALIQCFTEEMSVDLLEPYDGSEDNPTKKDAKTPTKKKKSQKELKSPSSAKKQTPKQKAKPSPKAARKASPQSPPKSPKAKKTKQETKKKASPKKTAKKKASPKKTGKAITSPWKKKEPKQAKKSGKR